MSEQTGLPVGENVIPIDVNNELEKIRSVIPFLIKGSKKSGFSVVKSGNKPNIKTIISRIKAFNVDWWDKKVFEDGNMLVVSGNNCSITVSTDIAASFLRCYLEFYEQGFNFSVININGEGVK